MPQITHMTLLARKSQNPTLRRWRFVEATYQDAATVTMPVRLTGSFPGSPIEVTYTFVLAGDRIASLEIR